jgi:hypothetical protein
MFKNQKMSILIVLTILFQSLPLNIWGANFTKDQLALEEYTIFTSNQKSDMKINASQASINGNIHSNSNIVFKGSKISIDGICDASGVADIINTEEISQINEKTENVEMIDFSKDIYSLASENATVYSESLKLNKNNTKIDTSIISKSLQVTGKELLASGYIISQNNININSANVQNINGEKVVIFSENGNITLNSSKVNLEGILYAPNGVININSSNFNFKGRLIADQILFHGSKFTVQEGENDFELITLQNIESELKITSPQVEESQFYTTDGNINLSGYFYGNEIAKIDYTVYVDGENIKNDNYPEIIKNGYNENKTVWEIDNFPVLNLATTIEINVVDTNDEEYTTWLDIIQQGDTDGDGLSDYLESVHKTSPLVTDTDNDGLTDEEEIYDYNTNPLVGDTDGDGINDGDEVLYSYSRTHDSEGIVYFIKIRKTELDPGILKSLNVIYEYGNDFPDDLDFNNEDDVNYFNWNYQMIPRLYTKLNPLKADTDEDGLSDGYELNVSLTNPSAYDTENDGISDGDRDTDKDGLSNWDEYINKTNPNSIDTDGDKISDYEELLESINTNPLMFDTDLDGTNDFDELFRGSDPQNPTEGGVNDDLFITEQVLDYSLLEHLNDGINVALPSITINSTGNINEHTTVYNVGDNPIIKDFSYAIVGYPLEIHTLDNIESAEIKFNLTSEYTSTEDIENLRIFYYNEESNAIEILPTEIDPSKSTISTTVEHFSIYGVLNLIKFLNEIQAKSEESQLEKGVADVVFAIDTTGSMRSTINNVKSNISIFVDNLNTKNVDVRLGLVEYKDIYSDGTDSTKVWGWYSTPDEFKVAMNNLQASGGGDWPESTGDAIETARRMEYREYAQKYIIVFTDAPNKVGTNYENVVTLSDVTNGVVNDDITVSVVSSSGTKYHYEEVYLQTSGMWADIYSNFLSILEKLVIKISDTTMDGTWIRLSNGTVVKLDKYPDNLDLETDTDKDGIPDSQELTTEYTVATTDSDGTKYTYKVWAFTTNPAKADTDGDGVIDSLDTNPNKLEGFANISVIPDEGNATEPFDFYTEVTSGLKDEFKYVLLQFKLPNGKWIELDDILANENSINRFSMNLESVIEGGLKDGVSKFRKRVWIIDPGLDSMQGVRSFRIVGVFNDNSKQPMFSKEQIFIVNSTEITLSGLLTSEISNINEFTIKVYDENVSKVEFLLASSNGFDNTFKVIDTINISNETSQYIYPFDSRLFENGDYEFYAKAYDSNGSELYATYHKIFTIINDTVAPKFSLNSGTYKTPQKIELTSDLNNIYFFYTLDGSEPTLKSQKYNPKNGIEIETSHLVKAIAWSEKSGISEVSTANYIIDETYSETETWNFQNKENTNNYENRLRFLSEKERLNAGANDKASVLLTQKLITINDRINKEIAKLYIQHAGSKAPSEYDTVEEVKNALRWDDQKVKKVYVQGEDFQKYGLDQRILLAIICQEGTGSFNTNPEVLDSHGGHYAQPDFDKDLKAAMDNQVVQKINAYRYYGNEFSDFVNSLDEKEWNYDVTRGHGSLYQFINYATLAATVENGELVKIERKGLYAEDNSWWSKVQSTFGAFVENNGENPSKKYDRYILGNKLPIKDGYILPETRFVQTQEGKHWVGGKTKWLSGYGMVKAIDPLNPIITYIDFPLEYHMVGSARDQDLVYQLQNNLNNNMVGAYLRNNLLLYADADFGKKTLAIVKLYQQQNGAEVTGIVDEKTFELIKNGTWTITAPEDGRYALRGAGSEAEYYWLPNSYNGLLPITKTRVDMVNKAKELFTYHYGDPVHYFWGGKYMNKLGYNSQWGNIKEVTSTKNWSTGEDSVFGLDCSGYTNWIAYQVTGINIGEGTKNQMNNLIPIADEDIKPGDFGFTESGGHVGMYIGNNDKNEPMFIHAAASNYGSPRAYIYNNGTIYADKDVLRELRKYDTSYITGKVTISSNKSKSQDSYIKESAQFVIQKASGQEIVLPYYVKAIKNSDGSIAKFVYFDKIEKKSYDAEIKEIPAYVENQKTSFVKFYRMNVKFADE